MEIWGSLEGVSLLKEVCHWDVLWPHEESASEFVCSFSCLQFRIHQALNPGCLSSILPQLLHLLSLGTGAKSNCLHLLNLQTSSFIWASACTVIFKWNSLYFFCYIMPSHFHYIIHSLRTLPGAILPPNKLQLMHYQLGNTPFSPTWFKNSHAWNIWISLSINCKLI